MKRIYISLPITGHEDTYEQRLDEAEKYVKVNLPEYKQIVTPEKVAARLEDIYFPLVPEYKDYLASDIIQLTNCHAIFLCHGWNESKGCLAEHAYADAIGLEILYLP